MCSERRDEEDMSRAIRVTRRARTRGLSSRLTVKLNLSDVRMLHQSNITRVWRIVHFDKRSARVIEIPTRRR